MGRGSLSSARITFTSERIEPIVRLRRTTAFITLVCLAAACGGAGDETAPTTTVPAADTGPTTSTSTTTTTSTTTQTETTTTTTTPPAIDPLLPTIGELGDLEADGEIDSVQLAVSEFAAIFGVEVDGAIPVSIDPTLATDPSSVIELLDALRPELTDTQRRQIDDALAVPADAVVLTNADIGDPDPGVSTTETTTPVTVDLEVEWNGLRQAPAVDPRLVGQLQAAQTFVMGSLGGTVPRFSARYVGPEELRADQSNWLGWARTRDDDGQRVCDITIVNFRPGTPSADAQLGTVIHEFFHCWHGQNFSGSVDSYRRSPRWVKEGLAKWVEAEAVETSAALTWAHQFLGPTSANLYQRSYAAVGFFWQVGYQAGGSQAIWDRIPTITDQADSPSAYDAAIAGLERTQYSSLASSSAQLDDFGNPWVFTSPLGPVLSREIRAVTVATAAGDAANAGGQTLTQFDYVSTGRPQVITTTHEGPNIIRWVSDPESRTALFDGGVNRYWCVDGPCLCEDGNPPFEPTVAVPANDPRLLVGLTGTADDGARFKTAIVDLEDACNPPNDSELEGEWIADIDAIRDAFNDAYNLIDINVTGVSGEIRMTLGADRVFVLSYDNVRLNLDDDFVGEIVVNGFGELQWAEVDGTVTISGLPKFDISVDTPELGGPPLRVTEAVLGSQRGELTFEADQEGNSLSVSNVEGSLAVVPPGQPNIIVFPTEWIRVG